MRADDLLNDSSFATTNASPEEISAVLECCTAKEIKVIADIVKAAKLSMDKYL